MATLESSRKLHIKPFASAHLWMHSVSLVLITCRIYYSGLESKQMEKHTREDNTMYAFKLQSPD